MKKSAPFRFAALALFAAAMICGDAAFAQRQKNYGSRPALPRWVQLPDAVRAKLERSMGQVYGGSAQAGRKTTAAERLVGYAEYDNSGGSVAFADSVRVVYNSATRGSAFSFAELRYDVDNYSYDQPVRYGDVSYILFDSLRRYATPGSPAFELMATRTYNSANKPLVFDIPDANYPERSVFGYNGAGKLVAYTDLQLDQTSGMLDSSMRSFYTYNSAGYVVRDSVESFDPGTRMWSPAYNIAYVVNSAGYATRATYYISFGPFSFAAFETVITYNAANQPVLFISRNANGPGSPMTDSQKDSIAYTSGQIVARKTYTKDSATAPYVLNFEEYRRLNAAGLPDSVWGRQGISANPDTSIQKLSYNANGNPTVSRYTNIYRGVSFISESRYYYGPFSPTSVGKQIAANGALTLYPNPARTQLSVGGSGRYSIVAASGAVVDAGTMDAGGAVAVAHLAPGIYTFTLLDGAGILRGARFVKE